MEDIRNHITVRKVVEVLGTDADLHLVGGAVRDRLLGHEPKDFDFATVLRPSEMILRCRHAGINFIETGIRRGTITIMIDGEPVEVTTFRNYNDENTFTNTIEEDLSARDFTFNAIAVNVHNGQIVDPFDGQGDLNRGIIRAVGNASLRFAEDPHRIIRLARFAAKFNFIIDENTKLAAIQGGNFVAFSRIAIERVEAELTKILTLQSGEMVAQAIRILLDFGFLEHFIPELVTCVGVEQNHFHSFDVFDHILSVISNTPNILEVRLAALLHDIGKPATITIGEDGVRHFLEHEDVGAEMTEEILRRLKFPSKIVKNVSHLVLNHMRPIQMGPKGIRRLIRDLDENLDNWITLKKADKEGGRPKEILDRFERDWKEFLLKLHEEQNRKEIHPFNDLAINGHDVLAFGVKKGPEVGRILKIIQEIVLDDPELNNKAILLGKVQDLVDKS